MSTEITPNTNTSNTLEYDRFHLELELDRDKLDFLLALNDIECNFDETFSALILTSPCCR